MKLNGILGKGSGKLGASVFSVSGGEQVVREYQPKVANPSTTSQVNQRAKLKLMSQLSAAMAPVIAIRKQGLQSARNLFVKKNIDAVIAGNGEAQISYENIQITNGNAGLPGLKVERGAETGIQVSLLESAAGAVSRVVYVAFKKTSEEQLQYIGSQITSTAGAGGDYQATFPYVAGDIVVYAYGIKDTNAAATAKYGNYAVQNGEDIARLLSNRSLSASDFHFTETRGATLFANESENETAGDDEAMVYITAQGPGSVSAPDFTNGRKAVALNTQVTITATANEGCEFLGWKNNGENTYFSTTNPLAITITGMRDIVGVFNDPNSANGGPDTD